MSQFQRTIQARVVPQRATDARDRFVAGATRALAARLGIEKPEHGNEFNGMDLPDLAAHALRMTGVDTRGFSRDDIARCVLAAQSTSDFPLLLANTAGLILRAGFRASKVTWNRWCRKGQVDNFREHTRIAMGSFELLATVRELGEFKRGTISEEWASIQASTKGRLLGLSRQMIVNDGLAAFADRARLLGQAAASAIESDVYDTLLSNSGNGPGMTDGGALFNSNPIAQEAGHANLASPGTVISVTSITTGVSAMARFKDPSKQDFIATPPRFLLCAPEWKAIAWDTLNSPTNVSQTNPGRRNYLRDEVNLEVISSPRLPAAPWFLVTDPDELPLIEVAFLDGKEEPFIDQAVDFYTDAVVMKVRLDYGTAAIDWRAGYRNPGP